jgi:molecular chaperone GrpE
MSEEPVSQPVDAPPAPADPMAELQRERDDYRDRWMRKAAEFDNYRRRVEKERREQADEAVESLLLDVLAVVDDFERALTVDANAGSDSADAYRKGVELIYAKFQDLLRKKGITPIAALGETFDPNIHQAVVHEASDEHREGEVTGELRKGYRIGDRLLRPALVKVAKAS